MSKYNARSVEVDGIRFDSGHEAHRYGDLRLLDRAGQISGLKVHPVYELCPSFVDIAGVKHRKAVYEADFEYRDKQAACLVAEDVKGMQTPLSALKFKLAAFLHPHIEFRIVKV